MKYRTKKKKKEKKHLKITIWIYLFQNLKMNIRISFIHIFICLFYLLMLKCDRSLAFENDERVPFENVPVGAASLAFVFDITGSMMDDLRQVIEGAAKILTTTLARGEKPLYNYVLVPFHDPGKKRNFFLSLSLYY